MKPASLWLVGHEYSEDQIDRLHIDLLTHGLNPTWGYRSLTDRDSLWQILRDEVPPNTFVGLTLTQPLVENSALLEEVQFAVEKPWAERGIVLFLILLDRVKTPTFLKSFHAFNLARDRELATKRMASTLSAVLPLDFREIAPGEFERLVLRLLKLVGFRDLQSQQSFQDFGFDALARYSASDPFMRTKDTLWAVEIKRTSKQTDLAALHQFVGAVAVYPTPIRGLFVTSSQLTSASRNWLHEVMRTRRATIEVLEGTDIKQLLLSYPRAITSKA